MFEFIVWVGFMVCMAILMAGVPKGRSKYTKVNRFDHPFPKYIRIK